MPVCDMHPQTAAWLKDLEELDQDLDNEEASMLCPVQNALWGHSGAVPNALLCPTRLLQLFTQNTT